MCTRLWPRIVDPQPHGKCPANGRNDTLVPDALLGGFVPMQCYEIELGPYQLVHGLVFRSYDRFAKSISTEPLLEQTIGWSEKTAKKTVW